MDAARVEVRRSKSGPTLHGVVIQEGRAARARREVFAPGSVTWPAEGMGVMARHSSNGGVVESRGMPRREANGIIRIAAPATPALQEAVESGRQYMSVEFFPMEERRTMGGIREIVKAFVPRVALMDDPEYAQTGAEVRRIEERQGGAFITSITTDTEMDCRCSGTLAEDNVLEVSFSPGSFDRVVREVDRGRRNVSAISRGAGDVVADVNSGSLSLRTGRGGELVIGIEALNTEAGRRTRELIDAGVEVHARPVLTPDSEFEVDGIVARVSDADFSYILVKPTDRTRGLRPLRSARSNRGEDRRAATRVEPPKALEAIVAPPGGNGIRRRLWL